MSKGSGEFADAGDERPAPVPVNAGGWSHGSNERLDEGIPERNVCGLEGDYRERNPALVLLGGALNKFGLWHGFVQKLDGESSRVLMNRVNA